MPCGPSCGPSPPHLLTNPDGTTYLGAPAVPATVSVGTESEAWFRSVAARLEGVGHHTIVGAGHAPHLAHVEAWVAHVIDSAAMSPVAS